MFLRERRFVAAVGSLVLFGLVAAGCGDDGDDGGEVRESGPGASASGSGSGSGSASAPASGSASGTAEECVLEGNSDKTPTATVEAKLAEFTIQPIPKEVAAGTINFVAVNEGAEPHEVVIVRYDGDPAEIPKGADGEADEAQLPEGAVIGEIEGFASGRACAAAFDLEPGKYVLLCNIVEEEGGEHEAHFEQGMYAPFTVT